MVRGFAILLAMQFVGETISSALSVPVPGNVVGMALLLLALGTGLIPLEAIREASELLLSHMALFFIPAGVGVMVYFDLLARQWLPIFVAMVVSTFVVMAVTGRVAQVLEKGEGRDVE